MTDLNMIVIPKIMTKWEELAQAFRYDNEIIDAIKLKKREDPKECCREFFRDWLQTNNGAKAGKKVWSTLLDTIKKIGLVGDDIREKMIADVKALQQ